MNPSAFTLRIARRLSLAILVCLSSLRSDAQKPQLVDNINPIYESAPHGLTLFNSKIVFGARDTPTASFPYGQYHLWDWSQMGQKARRLNADSGITYECVYDVYRAQPILAGKLYYARRNPLHLNYNYDIVAYDGLHPSVPIPLPTGAATPVYSCEGMFVLGNSLYFIGEDSLMRKNNPNVAYLYRYDGAHTPQPVARMFLSKKNNNGPANGAFGLGNSTYYGIFQNKIYYSNDSAGFGQELFCYNPSTGSTSIIADIAPGPRNSEISQYVAANNYLYFSATDSAHGRELYSYDGLAVTRLTDRKAGPADGVTDTMGIGAICYYNEQLLFCGKGDTARYAMYCYHIATGAISKLYETPKTDSIYMPPSGYYATPDRLYFYMGTRPAGNELWKYDSGKVTQIAHYNMATLNGSTLSESMLRYQGYLYFGYSDSTGDIELYRLQDSTSKPNGIQMQSTRWQGKAVLHPNPADNAAWLRITVPYTQRISISLIDAQGRVVYERGIIIQPAGTQDVSLPIQGLMPGQYFYRLSDNDGRPVAAGHMVRQ